MSLSTHCTSHITTGRFMGRGNHYIQLVKVLYCKLPTNGKQLSTFPLEVGPGFKLQSQRCEASMLPLCHLGPLLLPIKTISTSLCPNGSFHHGQPCLTPLNILLRCL